MQVRAQSAYRWCQYAVTHVGFYRIPYVSVRAADLADAVSADEIEYHDRVMAIVPDLGHEPYDEDAHGTHRNVFGVCSDGQSEEPVGFVDEDTDYWTDADE